MSKTIVEVHNYTDKLIHMEARVNRGVISIQKPLGKGKHPINWNIPDNSDSSKYFDGNQITITISDPKTNAELKSFTMWDDDYKDYAIYYCDGSDWKNTTRLMRGGNDGGNYTKVVLHISERPNDSDLAGISLPPEFQQYELTAVAITDAQLRTNVAKAFKAFQADPSIKLDPKKKYTNQEIIAMMSHPAFQPVKDAAAEGGCKSISLIFAGVEGTFVVGGQAYAGLLWGLSDGSVHGTFTIAVCLGVDVGVDYFAGVYISTGTPAEVGGLEFFAQFAAGDTLGMGMTRGVGLSGTRSVTIIGTLGVQVDVGVGVGWTKVTDV